MKTMEKYIPIWRNFCIIASTTLFLSGLFSSCSTEHIGDNEDPLTQLTGKDGDLNFVIDFVDYGKGEDISTRSAADLQAETVIVPLSDDVSMFATLEPVMKEVDSLSVGLRSFTLNTRIYIVAYKQSAVPTVFNYEHHVAFRVETAASASNLTREGSNPFVLEVGATYRFVAYSYNDDVTLLPEVVFPTTMNITDIHPGLDLIWGESSHILIAPGDNYITIPMKHLFSKVRIDALSSVGNFTNFTDVKMSGNTAELDVEKGILTAFADSTMLFTGFSPLNTTSVSSTPRIVYTAGSLPTIVNIGSINIGSTSYTNMTAIFSRQLMSGYEYHLKMRIGNSDDLIDDTTPAGMNMYVGAFWKSNQTGERLIRIPRPVASTADGVWSATVVEGNDWIALDKEWTTDGGVYGASPHTYETFPTFDAVHALSSSASSAVTGVLRANGSAGYQANDEFIRFRIGLKSTYTPSSNAPARYGVVLLTYANNTRRQRIFIRQGEQPDYLMRPGDLNGSGSSVPDNRSKARKFLPYNLTATNLNSVVDISGVSPTVNPGKSTAYPSQAGAMFQWAGSGANIRYAYDGYNSAASGWNSLFSSGFGSLLYATHETCPPGFRRPIDGPLNNYYLPGNVADSELRQSLFLDPVPSTGSSATNSLYGYYADGFFDRGMIANGIGSSAASNSTVATGTLNIAHIGRLFYNPNNHASLFFPSSGYRQNASTGAIQYMGAGSSYWTGTTQDNTYSWSLNLDPNNANLNYTIQKYAALSIRCVVATVNSSPRSVWLSPSTGNSSKMIQITSTDPWVAESPFPTNASLSVTSGAAGTTNITVTRSLTVFGLQTLVLRNTVNGELIYIPIDNYNIDDDEFEIPNNLLTGNTGEYEIYVDGGSETFTIVSHSPWLTAVKTAGGKLQLTAPQSPDQERRLGFITIAHANDPTYQVTFVVDQDLYTHIPPFRFFVLKFTWASNDIDIAVEFAGNDLMTNGQPVPFDNNRFYPAVTTADYRALGWSLASAIGPNGGRTSFTVTENSSIPNTFTQQQFSDSLIFWGGDATAGQGETVYFNAPLITPPSRKEDTSGLPRKIKMEIYTHWYGSGRNNPVRLRLSTYEGGVMKHCTLDNPAQNIRVKNFYNVNNYSLPLTPANINPPVFDETKVVIVDKQGVNTELPNFRTNFTHICTIEYDRYMRSATITWHATEYTGPVTFSAQPDLQQSAPKTEFKDIMNDDPKK